MDKRVCCVVLIIISLSLAQELPVVKYLRGVPRPNSAPLVDYYYSCCTAGATLQWQVNQNAIGFNAGVRTGSVRTQSTPNIRYTATLLSSRVFEGMLYTFDSVLIISSTDDNFTVSCTNGIETTPISTPISNSRQAGFLDESATNVFLQYQFSESILCPFTTYFYLCAVNDIAQGWLTNADEFGFSNQIIIEVSGIVRTTDEAAVLQQAILISREPTSYVSILLVTGIPGLNVTCSSTRPGATLFFSNVLSATTMTTLTTTEAFTTSDIDVSTDFPPTNGTTDNPAQESGIDTTVIAALGAVSGVSLSCNVLLVIWLCVCCCVIKVREKRRPNSGFPLRTISPSDGSDIKA